MAECGIHLSLPRYEEEIRKIIEVQGKPRFMTNGAVPVPPDGVFDVELGHACPVGEGKYLLRGMHVVKRKEENRFRKALWADIVAKIPAYQPGDDIFTVQWEWWFFKEVEFIYHLPPMYNSWYYIDLGSIHAKTSQIHYNPWKATFFFYTVYGNDYTISGSLPKKWKRKIPPAWVITNPKEWEDYEIEPG